MRASVATAVAQIGAWVKDKLAELKSKVAYIAKRIFQPTDLHQVGGSGSGVKGNYNRRYSQMEVFYQPGRDLTQDEMDKIDSVAAVIRLVAEGYEVTEREGIEQIWMPDPANPGFEESYAKISDELVCDRKGKVWRCHEENGKLVKDNRAEEAVITGYSSGGRVGEGSGLPKGYIEPGRKRISPAG